MHTVDSTCVDFTNALRRRPVTKQPVNATMAELHHPDEQGKSWHACAVDAALALYGVTGP